MEKCEVTIAKVRQRHSNFFRLTVYHYDSGKYFNHVFFEYSYLKSYAKRIGINPREMPLYKNVTCKGDFFRTDLNIDLDWQQELRNWYAEHK